MTPDEPDRSTMPNPRSTPLLDDSTVEELLAGRSVLGCDDLTAALTILRTADLDTAPPPRAALALLLATGLDPSRVPVDRRVPWPAQVAAALTASTGLLLSAATANALPAPLQSAVADAVATVTSFQLPRPEVALPAVSIPPRSGPPQAVDTTSAPGLADAAVPTAPPLPVDTGAGLRPEPVKDRDAEGRGSQADDSDLGDAAEQDDAVEAAPREMAGVDDGPDGSESGGADGATDAPPAPVAEAEAEVDQEDASAERNGPGPLGADRAEPVVGDDD